MKLQILSDLHLEENDYSIKETDADVIILAGDISIGSDAVDWIKQQTDKPVVYVAGNHEYYGHFCPELKYELRRKASRSNVHYLENEAVVINGVRFLGCTLWTEAKHELRYRQISKIRSFLGDKVRGGAFTSTDSKQLFDESIGWILYQLQDKTHPTVVVTHHAPSYKSNLIDGDECYIPPHEFDLVFAYMSDLDDFILKYKPEMWVHGHLHVSKDYMIGNTRICCNALGRTPYNPDFNDKFVVAI